MEKIEIQSFTGPNAEQIQYWNEAAGETWAAREDTLDQMRGVIVIDDRAGLNFFGKHGKQDTGCRVARTGAEDP